MQTPKKLHILLSQGTNPFLQEIRKGLEKSAGRLRNENVQLSLETFDPYAPATLVDKLKAGPEGSDIVITVGVDIPEVKIAVDALVAKGIRVVAVISEIPRTQRSAFVGQDNFSAGKAAGRLMCRSLGPGPRV